MDKGINKTLQNAVKEKKKQKFCKTVFVETAQLRDTQHASGADRQTEREEREISVKEIKIWKIIYNKEIEIEMSQRCNGMI